MFEDNVKSKKKLCGTDAYGFKKSPLMSQFLPVHFEINGNREVIVEGCRNVCEYDENMVKISVPKMMVCFYGRNLEIKCLNTDSLVIEGFITSVEFLT